MPSQNKNKTLQHQHTPHCMRPLWILQIHGDEAIGDLDEGELELSQPG